MKFLRAAKVKPLDLVIIALLFVASFSVLAFLPHKQVGATAQARVNGKLVKTFDLNQNQLWTYRSSDGDYNEIQVRDGQIRVKKANCRDQIDVKKGWVSRVGDTIVCLPHHLVIQVMSGHSDPKVDYTA